MALHQYTSENGCTFTLSSNALKKSKKIIRNSESYKGRVARYFAAQEDITDKGFVRVVAIYRSSLLTYKLKPD